MLTLREGQRRVILLRVGGLFTMSTTGLLLIVALLKSVYLIAVDSSAAPLGSLWVGPANLIVAIYGWAAEQTPVIAPMAWRLAPTLPLDSFLNDLGYRFWLIYALFLVGCYLVGRARRMSWAIKNAKASAQRSLWRDGLLEDGRRGATDGDHAVKVEIASSSDKLPWFQRPIGLVLLGIGLPMVVEVLKIVVGLAKLP